MFDWVKEHWYKVVVGVFWVIVLVVMVWSMYQSATQPKEGVVVRKDYHPEYTSTSYETVYQEGKSTRIPVQKYHGARYLITIRGVNSKGEEDFGYYDVTPSEYDRIEIGDYYVKQAE